MKTIYDYPELYDALININNEMQLNFYIKQIYKNDLKVVELCCGTGKIVSFLSNYKKDTKFYGIDINKNMLKLAKNKNNLEFINDDVLNLNIKNVDLFLLSENCINFFSDNDIKKLFNILKNSLSENGRILIDTFNWYNYKTFKNIKLKYGYTASSTIKNDEIKILIEDKSNKFYYDLNIKKDLDKLIKENFNIIRLYGDYDGSKLEPYSPKIIYLLTN